MSIQDKIKQKSKAFQENVISGQPLKDQEGTAMVYEGDKPKSDTPYKSNTQLVPAEVQDKVPLSGDIEPVGNLSNNQIISEDEKVQVDDLREAMTGAGDSVDTKNEMMDAKRDIADLRRSQEAHEENVIKGRKEKVFGKLAHLMAKPDIIEFELPCGYIDFGKIHKKVCICRMLGSEKRRMQAMAAKGNLIAFKDAMLTGSLVSIGDKYYNEAWHQAHAKKIGATLPKNYEAIDDDFLNSMCIPDRTFIMWQGFKLGAMRDDGTAPVTLEIACPSCEKKTQIKYDMAKAEFSTGESKGLSFDQKENTWIKRYSNDELGIEVVLRLANGSIQNEMLRMVKMNKTAEGLMMISDYVILEINGINRDELERIEPGLTVSKFLDLAQDDVINWIDWCTGDMTPGPEGKIEFNCVHCGQEIKQEVNIESFLSRTNFKEQTQSTKE